MSLPKHLGFLFAFLLVTAGVQASDRADPAYLDELLRQAVELRLSDAREWHLLLHYRENLWKGFTSEADGPAFFLAPNGKTDPAAELEATLRQQADQRPPGWRSNDAGGRFRPPVQHRGVRAQSVQRRA